jgi:hypothetical protein
LSSCYRAARAELTVTVTATAAANRYQQRSPTAHNTRTIRANWGYVRPEKRKVGSSILPLTTILTCADVDLVIAKSATRGAL